MALLFSQVYAEESAALFKMQKGELTVSLVSKPHQPLCIISCSYPHNKLWECMHNFQSEGIFALSLMWHQLCDWHRPAKTIHWWIYTTAVVISFGVWTKAWKIRYVLLKPFQRAAATTPPWVRGDGRVNLSICSGFFPQCAGQVQLSDCYWGWAYLNCLY